jgi:hypothetical protein
MLIISSLRMVLGATTQPVTSVSRQSDPNQETSSYRLSERIGPIAMDQIGEAPVRCALVQFRKIRFQVTGNLTVN